MNKTVKDNTSHSKTQEGGGKVQVKPFLSALDTILTNIREEEDQ